MEVPLRAHRLANARVPVPRVRHRATRGLAGVLVLFLGACGVDAGTRADVVDGGANLPSPADATSPPPSSFPEAGADGATLEAGPPPLTFDDRLQFDGPVSAILHSDGAWFVGGSFTRISTHAAPNFIKLQANGDVAPCPLDVVAHSPLLHAHDGGGDWFYVVTGSPGRIAKVRATTCEEDATFHAPTTGDVASGAVYTMIVAGTSLYVGGFGPTQMPSLAKLDATTGEEDTLFCPGDPFTRSLPYGGVYALAASDQALYVGGKFNAYRGTFVDNLVKLDLVTGALDATFDPPAPSPNGFNGEVRALALAGASLYVGGTFTDYRAAAGSANMLAKLDAATGALDTTFSTPAENGFASSNNPPTVNALVVVGTSLFVGGHFDIYRSHTLPAVSVAKLDLVTGALDGAFRPPAANGFGQGPAPQPAQQQLSQVFALAASDTSLYVGGTFHDDARSASDLAKLDLATGALDESFMPSGSTTRGLCPSDEFFRFNFRDPNRLGAESLVFADSTLWVAGQFSLYGGHRAQALAKLDDQTFALDTSFSPPARDSAAGGFDFVFTLGGGGVSALASTDDSIFVGIVDTFFLTYRGEQLLSPVLKLNKRTGTPDPTFLGPMDCDSIGALAVSGASLFLAGGISANHGTCVLKTDLTYGAHDPAFHWDGSKLWGWSLSALAFAGTSLYVGGSFSYCPTGSDPCVPMSLAKADMTSGAIDMTFAQTGDTGAFGSSAGGYDAVSALAVVGPSLYVAGGFTDYRGGVDAARKIAKIDLLSGALDTTFSPPGDNGFDATVVWALLVSGPSLYAAGDFSEYRGAKVSTGIAKLDLATGARDPSFGAPDGGFGSKTTSVYALGLAGTRLVAGGAFTSYGGTTALGWATLDPQSGAAK
jgi:Domain of unknown function (DUF5122) beta-propeller